MFDTYGPFILKAHDKVGIDNLYLQIRNEGTAELENGKGVYIIAVVDSFGNSQPWYVGKTSRQGFGTRLKQHFDRSKFAHLSGIGQVHVFLLALAHDGVIDLDPIEEESTRDWVISHLELLLIGTCCALNKDLENRHRYSSGSLHVPGYIDGASRDRNFPAAQALSKLLNT